MSCALGWGALTSARLVPWLWVKSIGSMFRADCSNEDMAEHKDSKARPVAGLR